MAERNVGYGFPRRIFKEKTILVDITKRSTRHNAAKRWLKTFFIDLKGFENSMNRQ